MLTDEEYTKVIADSKMRNVSRIAIFRSSKQAVSTVSTLTSIHRFMCLVFLCHVPLLGFSSVFASSLKFNLLGGFGASSFLVYVSRYYKMKVIQDFVLRIDFDVNSESFIVIMPPNSFK